MNGLASQSLSFHRYSFVKALITIFAGVLIVSTVLFAGPRGTVYADTPGLKGYVVGAGNVAAYTCPDTAKCQVALTLKPGTVVLIVDNVIGANVDGSGTSWRKILYQNQTLYVPMRFVSINSTGSSAGPDFTLVQIDNEDDSTTPPNFANAAPTAPNSTSIVIQCLRGFPCVRVILSCHPGTTLTINICTTTDKVTWYVATDGRINGGAGDHIAIYCRRTGRIEVWSITDSAGHFLVSFSHDAIIAAGRTGLSVPVNGQGTVTIGGDGNGTYWAAIHGGPYNATGAGDYAKIFNCY